MVNKVKCRPTGTAPPCRIWVWREALDTQKAESVSAPDAGLPHATPAGSAPASDAPVAAPARLRRPLLLHGEAAIAKAGLILCCIVLVTTAASGWWTYQAQHDALMAARLEQVQAVESLLWQSAEVMLSQNDISAVRRLVSDAGRTYNLKR